MQLPVSEIYLFTWGDPYLRLLGVLCYVQTLLCCIDPCIQIKHQEWVHLKNCKLATNSAAHEKKYHAHFEELFIKIILDLEILKQTSFH